MRFRDLGPMLALSLSTVALRGRRHRTGPSAPGKTGRQTGQSSSSAPRQAAAAVRPGDLVFLQNQIVTCFGGRRRGSASHVPRFTPRSKSDAVLYFSFE
jgi:hypothetical protein